MELFFLVVLGVIMFVLITSFRKEVKDNMRIMNKNIINVRKELAELQKKGSPVVKEKVVVPEKKPEVKPIKPLEVSGQRLSTQPKVPPVKKPETPKIETEKKPEVVSKPKMEKPPVVVEKKATPVMKPSVKKPEHTSPQVKKEAAKASKPKVKKDYEKMIGENWLNKIGIAILVIGIGFFVKYAIDKNWIGEAGRVAIGVGTGGILMGIAHFLRKKYRAFSSVLIGGGISTLYYTISIAYHDYNIFSQPVAFAIMVGITLLSTIAAILYDRKELAIIALIGGFTSPFMVQGETGNYVVFFTYIAIINSGMLVLSYFKKWPIISRLALGFTVLFFGTWMFIENMNETVKGQWALVFATIYFIQFLGANLLHNFVRKIKFNAWEFIQLSSITALYYGAMMYVISIQNFALTPGGFTLIMSFFYTALALFAHFQKGMDKALTYLLIGKALAFVTLTGALLFEGDYMTMFWAVEAVIILALGQKANMKILRNASVILTVVGAFGLVKDWMSDYLIHHNHMTPFGNETFLTGLFLIGTFIASFILVGREKDENAFFIKTKEYHIGLGALIFIGTYLTVLLELIHQMHRFNFDAGAQLVVWMFHFALILIGFIVAKARKSALMTQIFFFVGCVATVLYLFIAQRNNFDILSAATVDATKNGFYYLHFLLTAGVVGLLILLRNSSKRIFETQQHINWFLTAISIVGLIVATVELDQVMGFAFAPKFGLTKVLTHTRAEGYTILWGLYSFAIMIMGMKKKNRIMRILALVMFSVTLLKLFLFDIKNISEAGKIVAFISLGVLLLVVSFMYQKLKQLIIGETEENPEKPIIEQEA